LHCLVRGGQFVTLGPERASARQSGTNLYKCQHAEHGICVQQIVGFVIVGGICSNHNIHGLVICGQKKIKRGAGPLGLDKQVSHVGLHFGSRLASESALKVKRRNKEQIASYTEMISWSQETGLLHS